MAIHFNSLVFLALFTNTCNYSQCEVNLLINEFKKIFFYFAYTNIYRHKQQICINIHVKKCLLFIIIVKINRHFFRIAVCLYYNFLGQSYFKKEKYKCAAISVIYSKHLCIIIVLYVLLNHKSYITY